MKLTKQTLKQIIKEELEKTLNELEGQGVDMERASQIAKDPRTRDLLQFVPNKEAAINILMNYIKDITRETAEEALKQISYYEQ